MYQPLPPTPPKPQRVTRVNRIVLAVLVVSAVVMIILAPGNAAPVSASFSINTDGMMDTASSMFNSIWPVFAVLVGISVGVALAILIASKFIAAFKTGK